MGLVYSKLFANYRQPYLEGNMTMVQRYAGFLCFQVLSAGLMYHVVCLHVVRFHLRPATSTEYLVVVFCLGTTRSSVQGIGCLLW